MHTLMVVGGFKCMIFVSADTNIQVHVHVYRECNAVHNRRQGIATYLDKLTAKLDLPDKNATFSYFSLI